MLSFGSREETIGYSSVALVISNLHLTCANIIVQMMMIIMMMGIMMIIMIRNLSSRKLTFVTSSVHTIIELIPIILNELIHLTQSDRILVSQVHGKCAHPMPSNHSDPRLPQGFSIACHGHALAQPCSWWRR